MAELIADDIDFSAYETATEAAVKVRPASVFVEELEREFDQERKTNFPDMFSTKLRNDLQFRPAELTVWAGYSGARKSMFTGQVALDLCVQRQRVLIASFEMQPAKTLSRMTRQCLGVARPALESVRAFSKWTDGRLWIFDHMGRINPARCIAVLRYFATELKGQHAFVDSFMMVCGSEESSDEQKQFTTDLVRLCKETGLHIHLIAHCRKPMDDGRPPTKYDVRGSAAISDQADNVITLWGNKAKKQALEKCSHDQEALEQPDTIVSVEKQRDSGWEGKAKLWFDPASMRFCDDRLSRITPYPLQRGPAAARQQFEGGVA